MRLGNRQHGDRSGHEGRPRPLRLVPPAGAEEGGADRPRAALDLLGGIVRSGLHELAEFAHGDAPACTGLALAALAGGRAGAVLWVFQGPARRAHGMLSARGARAFGFDPGRLLAVRAEKTLDALWTVEEGVRSGAVAAVVAEVADASFTVTRRLALATARTGVPAILSLPHGREGSTAAATRWRVSARPAAPDPWDAAAPGAMRWRAALARARAAPGLAGRSFDLEFDDATLSLRLVPGLADRPAETRAPGGADGLAGPGAGRRAG